MRRTSRGAKGFACGWSWLAGHVVILRIALSLGRPAVHRNLKSRHLQMIALGGCIGTGLFLGSGSALRPPRFPRLRVQHCLGRVRVPLQPVIHHRIDHLGHHPGQLPQVLLRRKVAGSRPVRVPLRGAFPALALVLRVLHVHRHHPLQRIHHLPHW